MKVLRSLAALGAAGLVVLVSASGAHADDVTVGHSERTDTGYSVLVDVPAGTTVDLSSVTATVDGAPFDARAKLATDETDVQRTAVLAIDTSDSMSGGKFDAAKAAAAAFLSGAPANVAVGIVTFSSSVQDVLAPTLDHAQAASVLDGLALSKGTRLYDGVLDAVRLAGSAGPRTVIVLSDGADTNSDASLSAVTSAIDDGDVSVDVVALDQSAGSLGKLQQIAGDGQVVSAGSGALSQAFAAEADVLKRQVAVSIKVPDDAAAAQASKTVSIDVSLPTDVGSLDAQAAVPPSATAAPLPDLSTPVAEDGGLNAPHWVMYAGVVVFAAGLLIAIVMLVPAKPVPMTAAERVSTYTTTTGSVRQSKTKDDGEDVLATAKQAMAGVLEHNQSLDERITRRLDGAGSQLKSSEWLLLHTAVFLVATMVGLLLGRGNLVIGLIFMILGVVGPWLYLGIRRNRRRKAFNAALPDTLQLMSGSLSAGLSLGQSVDTIVREGADPIASEFRRVLVETRLGVTLEDAFDGVAERFESQDFAWVVMAIRIQRQVGGNLAELLDTVAATMREREYMRRQVASLAAEGKLSAYVLGGLPPAFLLYLLLASRTYVMPLFTDPRGWAMLAGGAILLSVGIFWMSRLVKVEV